MFFSRSTQAAMQSRHLAAATSLDSDESAHASSLHRALLRLFHSHTPSSVAAAIATAARLVALRISLRTAVLAHVSFSFCMSPSSFFACLVSFQTAPNFL